MSENKQENEKNTSNNKSSEPVQELEPQVIGGGLDPEFDDDKDMIFQAQMSVHQFLIANWKNLLSITIVFLLGVLIYGTYTNSVVEEQRGIHSELAKIQKRLPDTLVTGATTAQKSKLRASAAETEQVAKSASGVGAYYTWLEAGKMWMAAEEWDSAIGAFSNVDNNAPALLQWTVASQISTAYAEKGDKPKSIEVISKTIPQLEGILKEQGLLTLALLQEENGDLDGAKTSIDQLLQLNQTSEFILASNGLVERLAQRSLNDVNTDASQIIPSPDKTVQETPQEETQPEENK
jgi:tetratricopeptide (TPR) repeat protein